MNKYLLLSAAALLGTASPVYANDQTKQHVIHFNSYCDGVSFEKSGYGLATGMHLNADCAGQDTPLTGTVDKKAWHMNETFGSTSFTYDIFKPIRNGGMWDLWVCLNGTTCFEGNSGTYDKGPPGGARNRVSTKAKVAKTIAEFKAIRAHNGQ